MINKLCWVIVSAVPTRTRVIKIKDENYLLRFYIKHSSRTFPGIYLHYFYRGDAERDLHNHPWSKSISVILSGGYTEERLAEGQSGRANYKVIKRSIRSGSINIINGDDFHRVELTGKPTWTLFTSGKKIKDWGFLLRDSGKYLQHETYEEYKKNDS